MDPVDLGVRRWETRGNGLSRGDAAGEGRASRRGCNEGGKVASASCEDTGMPDQGKVLSYALRKRTKLKYILVCRCQEDSCG